MHIERRLRVLLGPREAPDAHCGDLSVKRNTKYIYLLAIFFSFLGRKIKESRCASPERKI